MSNFVYVVTIASTQWSSVARVFTNEADADTFIAYSKKVESETEREGPRPHWEYETHLVELDGDPYGTF